MSSFPLVYFLITLLLGAALCIQGQQTVKDTAGNPVLAGKQYLIQSVQPTGALVSAPFTLFSICPPRVIQIPLPFTWGAPVRFAFIWSATKQTIVDTYSDVTIEFMSDTWTSCSGLSKFLAFNESSSSDHPILMGGRPSRTNSWFKINKAGADVYELTTSTGSVGVGPGGWFWRWFCSQLILTTDNAKTLFVKFQKVDNATTATTSSRVEKLGLRLALE